MKNEYVPYPAIIEHIQQETPDARTFRARFINSNLAESFRHRPGQFMEISILGLGEAPISIASSPSRHGCLEFTIRAVGSVTGSPQNLWVNCGTVKTFGLITYFEPGIYISCSDLSVFCKVSLHLIQKKQKKI